MATRTSSPARSAAPGRKKTTTNAARASSGSSRPGQRKTSSRTPARPDRPALPVRILKGIWMGAAHVAGGTARSVGSSAKNLDPAHRRDGIAFLLLGLAVVVAVREWFGLSGTAGEIIHAAIAGAVGMLGIVVPLILLFFAIRLMRHPDRPEVNGRISIGLVAITTAICGLLAVANELPDPPAWQDVFDACGVLGWVAANPLSTAVTVYVTVPVLALLLIFGLLVVTATPVA